MTENSAGYRILVVDDEESMREILSIMLHREGYRVDAVSDGAQAVDKLREKSYDLVVSDIKMPRMDGFKLLAHIKERSPQADVIMITAFSSTQEAVEAMKKGAYDYITKPFRNEEIRLIIKNALERRELRQKSRSKKKRPAQRSSFSGLIGKSKEMQAVYDLIEKVAASAANILITGESGTGKELAARAIHYNSGRKAQPFVPINCGAIPENLLESELFGHEKGAFTGAVQQKAGLFEVANGGTLFLDEVGELPSMMQVKLLRVLQDRQFRRVGGTRDLTVDVRLIAATNKDLEREVSRGYFREDLFYRLNVIRLALPPLRERREDIPPLVEHFRRRMAGESEIKVPDSTMRRLLDYRWPGNIRELENAIERCVILGRSGEISEDCLPESLLSRGAPNAGGEIEIPETGLDLDACLGSIEKDILLKALDRAGGVRKKAAELLGITFRSMRYRLAKFDIDPDDE